MTVTDVSITCAIVIFRVKRSFITLVDGIVLWLLILLVIIVSVLTVTLVSNTQTNVNSGPVTTAIIPYIRGTSETIARVLQPYNIRVAHKPMTTLRRLLTNVKDKPEDRRGAVYKIKCYDSQAT